ncbi:sensor histidine kinase [Marinimicrobium alkaliphilum]|uniref:sensor histidine kinase n=1 Tax=Marinimicrobium alkaliphilum TaxID=2202654 RepID=UPI000DB943BE|nr:sensor histidine kinase [Marinimicrobium alkaliphilum]
MYHSYLGLTRRLLLVLIVPTAALALILGAGGILVIDRIVEGVNDRVLGASARIIAETVAIEDEQITFDLPPWALGMLETDLRNNVYYSVREGQELVSGYDLPKAESLSDRDGEVTFKYANFRGFPVRIASTRERVSLIQPPVVIQVAETLDTREALRQRMIVGLVFLEVLLIGLIVLLLPLAVRWGLQPLNILRQNIERRSSRDLTPIALDQVPSELHELITGFNSLLSRVERAIETMRRFTADAAHQMRTPLSILKTHLSLIKPEYINDQPAKQSLEDIQAATAHLQRLLTQLLALARADEASKGTAIRMEHTNIVQLARLVAEEIAPVAVRADIDLHFEAPDASLTVVTEQTLASELLTNIIDNAIRYNQRGGHVSIKLTSADSGVIVVIEDDGPGIDPAYRQAVFSRFYRLDRDHPRQGSGLGLAIVKETAERLGVKVRLLDPRASSHGLRVEVIFPTSQPLA